MMSCAQAGVFSSNVRLRAANRAHSYEDSPRSLSIPSRLRNFDPSRFKNDGKAFPSLVCCSWRNRRAGPVCFAKGSSKSEGEGFSWDSLRDAVGGLRKDESVQDWLNKQMRQNEFDGDGGDGGRPGGRGDGAGGEGDEGFSGILDELLQVILATIGFIFVYIYLIRGAELTRLARDYFKYVFGGTASVRLRKAMDKWERFLESITRTVDVREDWLERAIVLTPTWWHKPRELAQLIRSSQAKQPIMGKEDTGDDYD